MNQFPEPLDLSGVKVKPLELRRSLSSLGKILVDPEASPAACDDVSRASIRQCAAEIREARQRQASVMLVYGAHLVKNGATAIVNALIRNRWITHLATNGAGTIHDWELAFCGKTEESVRDNVCKGEFGTWDETGRYINLAVLAGGLSGEGYGRSLGRLICDDEITLPSVEELRHQIASESGHPLTAARAELLQTMLRQNLSGGRIEVKHPHKHHSILAAAFQCQVPFTVHPGIGYDLFATHPWIRGAAIGRAGAVEFRLFSHLP